MIKKLILRLIGSDFDAKKVLNLYFYLVTAVLTILLGFIIYSDLTTILKRQNLFVILLIIILSIVALIVGAIVFIRILYDIWMTKTVDDIIIEALIKSDLLTEKEIQSAKSRYMNTSLDYYVINCIYAFTLSLVGGLLIYVTIPFKIEISVLIIMIYYIIEVRLLFYGEVIDEVLKGGNSDGFKSWRSWPTLGIFMASPLLLFYFLIRQRNPGYLSQRGLMNMWAITRYIITNPKLPEIGSKYDKNLGRLGHLKIVPGSHNSSDQTAPISDTL